LPTDVTGQAVKPARHLEWIDFLRGLSALAIVLFHVRVNLWVGWVAIHTQPGAYSPFDRAAAWLSVLTPFFGSAVMLFFLVSGFCVHYPYAGAGRGLDILPYARRRFVRIYPPYLMAVVLTVLVEWVLGRYYQGQSSSAATVLRSAFMLQNFGAQAGQMAANPSLWSLPVEAELYIVYPLFLYLLTRFGGRWAMALAGGVSLAALGLSLVPRLDQTLFIAGHFAVYWIIWCAGALLAEGIKRERLPAWRPWMGLAMAVALAAALVLEVGKLPLEVRHLTWAAFYFICLLWGLTRPNPLRRWRTSARRTFAGLGKISYSLYLIHFPFFMLCGAFWQSEFGGKPTNFLIPLIFCVLVLPLAYVFYACFEAPSHRFARMASRRRGALTGPALPPFADGVPPDPVSVP
jgi:peptidoglycan/LPS O-acetylase OafA/YrhL